jgi:hypothetical protein
MHANAPDAVPLVLPGEAAVFAIHVLVRGDGWEYFGQLVEAQAELLRRTIDEDEMDAGTEVVVFDPMHPDVPEGGWHCPADYAEHYPADPANPDSECGYCGARPSDA